MSYEKPRQRKGMVCYSVRWDRDGKVREAIYRPITKADIEPDIGVRCTRPEKPSRGATVELQAKLI